MRVFLDLVQPPPDARILDLGGTPYNWSLIDHSFDVTLVNLPGAYQSDTPQEGAIKMLRGDATNLKKELADQSFDVVFSNSVIEHVGGPDKQEQMASEVHRLGKSHWIQTPSDKFPLEVHTGVPFFFRLPDAAREALLTSWNRRLPEWTEMIYGTTVLTQDRMRELFPSSRVFIERKLGLEKSYAFYRAHPRASA